jgi:hypothetical protein
LLYVFYLGLIADDDRKVVKRHKKKIIIFSNIGCSPPGSLGPNMMLASGSTEGVALYERGAIFTIICIKGSAFNAKDLVSKKLTKGKTATDEERFGNLTMRCTDKDAWERHLYRALQSAQVT